MQSSTTIRVVVADASPITCQLLAEGLSRTGQFEALPAQNLEHAQQLLEGEGSDILLISPGFLNNHANGLSFFKQFVRPNETAIVVLLDAADKTAVIEAFRAGARGIFNRTDSFAALCKCIACVHQGQVWADSETVNHLLTALVEPIHILNDAPLSRPLSHREEEIARLVAQGFSNREISERLKLSEHTVKNYLFRAFEKLGVSSRVELTLHAIKGNHSDRPAPSPKARRAHNREVART
ncbi:MAG TPA: response regulator transcription factor [Terriglobales bacterium]